MFCNWNECCSYFSLDYSLTILGRKAVDMATFFFGTLLYHTSAQEGKTGAIKEWTIAHDSVSVGWSQFLPSSSLAKWFVLHEQTSKEAPNTQKSNCLSKRIKGIAKQKRLPSISSFEPTSISSQKPPLCPLFLKREEEKGVLAAKDTSKSKCSSPCSTLQVEQSVFSGLFTSKSLASSSSSFPQHHTL